MNIKKLISIFLAVILTLPLLASCTKKEDKSVMKVGDFDVPYHVYRYVVVNSRTDVEKEYGADVWNGGKADEAKTALAKRIKETLASLYTVCSLGADYQLTWDCDQVSAEADLRYKATVSEYASEKEFKADLEAMAMNEDTFRFVLANDILNEATYAAMIDSKDEYTDTDALTKLFEGEKFIRVKQILVGGENAGTDAQNLKKAEEIKARLDAGEDFDTLCQKYNNDLYMFENDDGYYIMRGTRNFEFEEAAFSLEVGEISDVVKTDAGYSIIKRYEKDADYINDNFNALSEEYHESLYTVLYEERYESIYSGITSLPESYSITTLK